VRSTTSGAGGNEDENRIEPSGQPQTAVVGDERPEGHHDETTVAAAGRSGRQFYQTYQQPPFPQRRAYKGPGRKKKRPMRTKSVRRPRPRRRPGAGPMMRYKRLPPPRAQQQQVNNNYVDAVGGGVDYDDESQQSVSSLDYGEREFNRHAAYLYGTTGPITAAAVPAVAVVHASPGRARKRHPYAADEPHQQTVAVLPVVRATRPVIATPTVAAVDTMEKLKQMVHEAMDEHFATRHQELYADGFEKQRPHHQNQVYSAKYKQQPDKQQQQDKQQRTTPSVEANRPSALPLTLAAAKNKDPSSSDADADGSDDRLTLAEISAYMGAKPVETVLSAGGHRYVLSDAIQQSYRQQQQQQQKRYVGGDEEDHHQQHGQRQYLRYVSPFEALYELPAARWTYK